MYGIVVGGDGGGFVTCGCGSFGCVCVSILSQSYLTQAHTLDRVRDE